MIFFCSYVVVNSLNSGRTWQICNNYRKLRVTNYNLYQFIIITHPVSRQAGLGPSLPRFTKSTEDNLLVMKVVHFWNWTNMNMNIYMHYITYFSYIFWFWFEAKGITKQFKHLSILPWLCVCTTCLYIQVTIKYQVLLKLGLSFCVSFATCQCVSHVMALSV